MSPSKLNIRVPWDNFPDVVVHTNAQSLKSHPAYSAAKVGDYQAASQLATDLIKPHKIPSNIKYIVPVIQVDRSVHNAIPIAAAQLVEKITGIRAWPAIVQTNQVYHTGASAHIRITGQPLFAGQIPPGNCLIIDDVVTYGSTLANLRGYIHSQGGHVVAASSLAAGGFGSTKLVPQPTFLKTIQSDYGNDLNILCSQIGFKSDCLTAREVQFLAGLKNVERFRTTFSQTIGLPRTSNSQGPRI